MRGQDLWSVGQCNERPKKTALDGADILTYGQGDSMTNLVQWGQVGEHLERLYNGLVVLFLVCSLH